MNWVNMEGNYWNFFFLREFQLMASAPDDNFLSSDQDTNQFLEYHKYILPPLI